MLKWKITALLGSRVRACRPGLGLCAAEKRDWILRAACLYGPAGEARRAREAIRGSDRGYLTQGTASPNVGYWIPQQSTPSSASPPRTPLSISAGIRRRGRARQAVDGCARRSEFAEVVIEAGEKS